MKNKQIKHGDVFPTNEGGSVTVLQYRNAHGVIIQHNDDYGHIATVRAGDLRRGMVKNPYHRSVYGVGFIGVGEHLVSVNRKLTPVYKTWNSMFERCYDPKFHAKRPTYIGCTVHPNWHNFQVFAEWFERQYFASGWQLDKDLTTEGNKVYSPITCTFVPHQLNTLLIDCGASRGDLPQGVTRHGKRYQAQLSIDGNQHKLGTYATPEEAFEIYKFAKEENIKRMAGLWKGLIDPRVYDLLINYEVKP